MKFWAGLLVHQKQAFVLQEYLTKRWFNTIFLDPAFHFLILQSIIFIENFRKLGYPLFTGSKVFKKLNHGKWDLLVLLYIHVLGSHTNSYQLYTLFQNGCHFINCFVCLQISPCCPILKLRREKSIYE